MVLWRISNYATLDGAGGLKASARWHTRGHRIVYLSATPASALLEILVHLEIEPGRLPRSYKLLEIFVPDNILIEKAEKIRKLSKGWTKKPALTRAIGDGWLSRSSSALLEVPSALAPHTRNFLLNPLHADAAKAKILSVSKQPLDSRLLQ